MKSREEYEASIYAKRDAFLAKRKKKIQMTVSALSVIICLGAAVFALPKLTDKSDEAQAPSVTKDASANSVTENKIADEAGQTYLADFAVIRTQTAHGAAFDKNGANEEIIQEDETIEYLTMAGESEIYRVPETEIALETEIAVEDGAGEYPAGDKHFAYNPSDETPDSDTTPPSSSKKTYTTEEITAAALKHLPEGDADKIIGGKTNSVVSRKSDGTTTYAVYFYTAEKKFTVKLSDSLELIEITEKGNAGGGTTQIAPAYNPNA